MNFENKSLVKNLSAILIPALICIIIFLLPQNTQNLLALNLANLNLWNWFTSNFVHENFKHLAGNLAVYLISSFMAYLTLPEKYRTKFSLNLISLIVIVSFSTFLIIWLLKVLGVFSPNIIYSKGFSGISSATLGLLGTSIVRRLEFLLNLDGRKNLCFYFGWRILLHLFPQAVLRSR